jgi:hypothetical protein
MKKSRRAKAFIGNVRLARKRISACGSTANLPNTLDGWKNFAHTPRGKLPVDFGASSIISSNHDS